MQKLFFMKFSFLYLVVFFFQKFIYSKTFLWNSNISYLFLIMTMFVFILTFMSKKMFMSKKNMVFSFLLFFLVFMIYLFFFSEKIFFFFFFFEASIIPIFLIISFWGYQLERIQSSFYLLLYTSFFSLPFFFVLIFLGKSLSIMFSMKNFFLISEVLSFILIFLFLVKMPLYFFHLWLPKAHVESPVMGSIILAGVLLKLGGFGLLRVWFFFSLSKIFKNFLLIFSFLGLIFSFLICLFQSDQKSMIAYASVGHMTVLVPLIFCSSFYSFKIFILLMFVHAFCSSILFFFSYLFFLTNSSRLIQLNQGMAHKSSFIFFMIMIFLLMNFSVPPFPSFFSEFMIFSVFLKKSKFLMLLIFFVVFIGCCYSIYLLVNSFHGKIFFEEFVKILFSFKFLFLPFFMFILLFLFFLDSIF